MAQLNVVPAAFDAASLEEFVESGKTITSTLSPHDASLALFVSPSTKLVLDKSRSVGRHDKHHIYLAGLSQAPSGERRLFITDTSIIFIAFRKLLEDETESQPLDLPGVNQKSLVKLANDYANHIKECWVHASQPINRPDGPLEYDSDHYRSLYTCFTLFILLYMPEAELEDAPVGDELMEWLNTHFIEPSTEEGDHLSVLTKPWEDENFWPYLTRTTLRGLSKATIFFLETLSKHPSSFTRQIASKLIPVLSSHPRLQNHASEREYAAAHRKWKETVKTLRLALDQIPEKERTDQFENWWSRISDIVGILEGRGEVVKRVSYELGSDWKEVCAAWGIYVDPRLRRKDLPDLVTSLVDDMPPDPTNPEDTIQLSMLLGNPVDALDRAAQLDIWLAAHLADIMEPLQLLDGDADENTGLTIRQHYILSYAEYLRSDPGLWRIAVEYMCSCGILGQERADEVLVRVSLRLNEKMTTTDATAATATTTDETEVAGNILSGDVVGVLKELNATCFAHHREEVRRMVCKIAARTFVETKQYGLAVSYYTSAEDWPGLGRVVERVLGEYVLHGPETFVRAVAEIAPSLQQLRSDWTTDGIFIRRLIFAVRYAEFHQKRVEQDLQDAALDLISMFQDDVVPKAWWGVLLCDSVNLLQYGDAMLFSSTGACELLHRLEEIQIRTSQGSGDDYLSVLAKTIAVDGEQEVLIRLRTVRVALARYLARCAVIDVGGRDMHITQPRLIGRTTGPAIHSTL